MINQCLPFIRIHETQILSIIEHHWPAILAQISPNETKTSEGICLPHRPRFEQDISNTIMTFPGN